MDEIWKDIKGYEGLYQGSNWGRAKSLDRYVKGKGHSLQFKKGRILKPMKDNNGYLFVRLSKDGKHTTFNIHRLVAEHFLDNPNNYKEVNHKDENKTNNVVTNLEWCDRKYNCNYGTRTEKCSKKVYQYTLDGQFVKEWSSTMECGRNGYIQQAISACCNGKQKAHKGFIWSYNKF